MSHGLESGLRSELQGAEAADQLGLGKSGHARTERFQEIGGQKGGTSETPLHRGIFSQLVRVTRVCVFICFWSVFEGKF